MSSLWDPTDLTDLTGPIGLIVQTTLMAANILHGLEVGAGEEAEVPIELLVGISAIKLFSTQIYKSKFRIYKVRGRTASQQPTHLKDLMISDPHQLLQIRHYMADLGFNTHYHSL